MRSRWLIAIIIAIVAGSIFGTVGWVIDIVIAIIIIIALSPAKTTSNSVNGRKLVKWEDINMKAFAEGMAFHAACEAKLGQFMRNVSNKTADVMKFMEENHPPQYLFATSFGGIASAAQTGESIEFHIIMLTASAKRGYMPSQFF